MHKSPFDTADNSHSLSGDSAYQQNKGVKIFSFDNSSDFNCWLTGLRLAKYGTALRSTFRELVGRKNQYGKDLCFIIHKVIKTINFTLRNKI